MADLNKDYWEDRYQSASTGWDIGEISTPIRTFVDGLENKSTSILIPGAGNGHEAIYMHRQGFTTVTVLDFAKSPLDTLQQNCPDFPKQHLIQDDFFNHEGTYDLIIEQTFFCALNPNSRQAYVEKMHQLIKPGGYLAGLLFGIEMHDAGPPFGGSVEEYEYLFSSYFNIEKMEPCYNSISPRKGKELFVILQNKN